MAFLSENVILTGHGGHLDLDVEHWCALLNLGMMAEPDQEGRPLPDEVWRQEYMFAMLHDERFPVTLSVEQAKAFGDSLEFYSAGIPEREEIGKVLTTICMLVDSEPKTYAVTTGKGWIETDDVELVFLEEGKDIIRQAVTLLRKGAVKVELASRLSELGGR